MAGDGPACCAAPVPAQALGALLSPAGTALLTSASRSPQGIERLQRKDRPRQQACSWQPVKETFGGDFSPNWCNPFSGHPEIPPDKDLVRQASQSDTDNTETTEKPSETKDEDRVEVTDD